MSMFAVAVTAALGFLLVSCVGRLQMLSVVFGCGSGVQVVGGVALQPCRSGLGRTRFMWGSVANGIGTRVFCR